MPRFSVVIPTYNRSAALHEAICSVLQQTFDDYEIFVVDDGSTDNTKEVVASFSDRRIKYLWIPNSGGPATPRNIAIDKSSSDWVCFLDSDDLWYPSKLGIINQNIVAHPEADAFCHDQNYFDRHTGKKGLVRCGPFTDDFYRKMLLFEVTIVNSAMTVRKSFLRHHDLRLNTHPEYVSVEDFDLWLKMAYHGARFHFVHLLLGVNLVHVGNISGFTEKHLRNVLFMFKEHVFKIQKFELDKTKLWKTIQYLTYMRFAINELKELRLTEFKKYFAMSVRISPLAVGHHLYLKLLKMGL